MDWLKEHTTDDDGLTSGQIVIIAARWILIVGALVLTLWNPGGTPELWKVQVQTGLLLAYAVVNFFLHAQYIREGDELPQIAYVTSLVDLALITFVVGIQETPIDASVYVFYLPAVLAISVAFRRQLATAYIVGVMVAYGMIAVGGSAGEVTAGQAQDLVMRLLMIAAVGFTGGLFKHIEDQRWAGNGKAFSFMSGKPRTQRRRATVSHDAATKAAAAQGSPAQATEGAE